MDKTLYISYAVFKEDPSKSILVKLKNGNCFFYQFMCDSSKRLDSRLSDLQAVTIINTKDILGYEHISPSATVAEFRRLTQDYVLSDEIEEKLEKDTQKEILMTNVQKIKNI